VTQTALEHTGLALDGPSSLARLQQMSRIAASTWQRWCELLQLSPSKATEVWEEICAPLEQVSGQRPNISYFLRLRAARDAVDIQSFKEEVAPIRHMLGFFRMIDDSSVDIDELPSTMLSYYKFALEHTFRRQPFERFVDQWIYDICRVFLVTKLCKSDQVTLSKALRMIADERISLDKMLTSAVKSCGSDELSLNIRTFLSQSTEDCKKKSSQQIIELFRQIIETIYNDEAAHTKGHSQDPMLLEKRRRTLQAFDPQSANLPSPEEAQALSRKNDKKRQDAKTALAA